MSIPMPAHVAEADMQKAGVIVGDDVHALFKHAQSEGYAIPAINVTSSSTVIASLEAARDAKSPISRYTFSELAN